MRNLPSSAVPVPRVTVTGTGYLGATHAICMAIMGFEVLGADVDRNKIDMLCAGCVPFFEPGLPEKLHEALASGRLHFTTDFDEVAQFSDVHFLCVGTPQQDDSWAADMRFVHEVVDGLVPHLERPALLVGKSTVPVGTAAGATSL